MATGLARSVGIGRRIEELDHIDGNEPHWQTVDQEQDLEDLRPSVASRTATTAGVRLAAAKKQARLSQLRLHVPTVSCGVIALISGVLLFARFPLHSPLYILGHYLAVFGVFIGLLAFLPSDQRALPLCGYFLFIPGGFCFAIYYARQSLQWLRMLYGDENCEYGESVSPCWFICVLVVLRIGHIIPCIILIVRIIRTLRRKASSKVLLSTYWSTLGWMVLYNGMAAIPKLPCALAASVPAKISISIFVRGVASLGVGFNMVANSALRHRMQSWFMSRGESAVTAAGVAQLLGDKNVDALLQAARTSFKFVRADRVVEAAMERNEPDPELARHTDKGRLGFVDAFLSHSWHDDPHMKWIAMQELRKEFKAEHSREPRLWIDKYCIDQNSIDMSLAALPVYLSGCSQLWILCGSTYLERLWCIIEIFVFLEMGGLRSNLKVVLLEDLKSALDSTSDTKSIHSLEDRLGRFDPRKARCFTEYDTDRLHAVIDAVGYEPICELIKCVFLKKDDNPQPLDLRVV